MLYVIGQIEKLSDKDIYKLNAMYECRAIANAQWYRQMISPEKVLIHRLNL